MSFSSLSLLWFRCLLILLLGFLFSVEGRSDGRLPHIYLSCGGNIDPGSSASVTASIWPESATLDSDLTVSISAGDARVTTTNPVIKAGASSGSGSASPAAGRGGYNVHVSASPISGYHIHTASCSFNVNTPPRPRQRLTLSKTSVTVQEDGGTDTYTVRLATKPTATVTVTPSSGDKNAATVKPSNLMFTTTSWNRTQTVTVTGVNDDVDSNRTTTITHSVTGGDYAGISSTPVTVTLTDDDDKGVTVSEGSLTLAEAGGTGTYTIALDSEPTGTVTVAVASGAAAVAKASPSSLTFDSSDWSVPKTVTVTAVDDKVDSDRTTSITHRVSGADYAGETARSVSVTLTDDDTRGVTLSSKSLSVAEDGGTGTYTVKLDSQPTGTVTVGVTSGAATVARVSPASLMFTTSSWSMPQEVTVTGVGSGGSSTSIAHAVSGGDYGSVSADSVSVSLVDVAINLSVSDASVGESDSAQTITVTATIQGGTTFDSAKMVAVTVSGSGTPEAVGFEPVTAFNITIAGGATSGMGSFTLTPVADDVDEADETLTLSGTAGVLTVNPAMITLTDDDTRGVAVSKESLTLAEAGGGSSGTYTVKLDSQPTAGVLIVLTSRDTAVARVSPQILSFTSSTWDRPQTVTVRAVDDDVDSDRTASVTHAVSGGDYGSVTAAAVSVTLTDDDDKGVRVLDTDLAIDEGDSGNFCFQLESEPTASVVVSVSVTGAATVSTPAAQFTIRRSRWDQLRCVPVLAGHDPDATDEEATLTLSFSGGGYGTVTADSVSVTVTDDEEVGVLISSGGITVTEDGGTGTYTVWLATRPTAAVTVTPSSADEMVATVMPPSLMFDSSDWDRPKRLTVTGVDDKVDSDRTTSITHAVTGGDYGSVEAPGVTVLLTDDDTRGVTLSKDSLALVEAGGTGSYTVRLDSQPTGTVTVRVTSGDTAVARISPATLAFSTMNWNMPQKVTVTGVGKGGASTSISHAVSGGDYGTLTAPAVTVTLADVTIDLSVDDSEVSEADPAQTINVTATVAGATLFSETRTIAITVTGSGTAEAVDFEEVSGFDITIAAGERAGTGSFTLTPVTDQVDEVDETLTISGAAGTVMVNPATITLTDDDDAPTGIQLKVSPASLAEGAGATVVTVTADLAGGTTLAEDLAVSLTLAGTAVRGTDYTLTGTESISITAGQASGSTQLTLTPTQDQIHENEETIDVSGAAEGLTVTGATITLTDDDAAPAVALSVTPSSFAEGGSATAVTVTATATGEIGSAEIALSLAGTALKDTDYTVAGTLSIPITDSVTGQTVLSFLPTQDNLAEGPETIEVSGAAEGLTVTGATITLTDDEPAPSVALSVDPSGFAEDGSATAVTVTATAGAPWPHEIAVALSLAGTAVEDSDYRVTGTRSITVAPGAASGNTSLSFTAIADDLDEGSGETVLIEGAATPDGIAVAPATLVLTDDDTAGARASPEELQIIEGARDSYELVLTSRPSSSVTIDITRIGEGVEEVDWTPKRLTFGPSVWDRPQEVTVTVGEDADLDDEVALLRHTAASLDPAYEGVGIDDVEVIAGDNDQQVTSAELSLSDTEIAEGEASALVTVIATLDAFTTTGVTISLSLGGTAAPEDYTAAGTLAVEVPAGRKSGTSVLTFVPVDDALVEGPETIEISGTAAGLTVTGAELTLLDNDLQVTSAELSLSDDEIAEGEGPSAVTVTATLDKVTSLELRITLSLTGEASQEDYTVGGELAVVVDAGSRSGTTVLTFAPVDDALVEGAETIEISGTAAGLTVTGAELTLADNDQKVTSARLSLSDDEIAEGQTSALVTVTATLDAVTSSGVSIALSLGGTASADDYSVGGAQLIEVEPGKTAGTTVLTFAPIDDARVEGNETIIVNGSAPGLTVSQATLTLTDDDTSAGEAAGALSVDLERVAESARDTLVTVTLTLDEGFTFDELRTFRVRVRGSGNEAAVDFAPVPPLTLTLLSNVSSAQSTFALRPENDLVDEIDETITVSAVDSPVPLTPATITLVDDDAPPTGISLSVDDPDIGEGEGTAEIVVTARVEGGTTYARALAVALELGGTATEGAEGDYTVSGLRSITLPAGAGTATATLAFTPIDDARDELDETILISGNAGPTIAVSPVSLTLLDNDESLLHLTTTPARIAEGDPAVALTVTVRVRSGTPYDTDLRVDLELGGTAARGEDYEVAGSLSLRIPAGSVSAATRLSLTAVDDRLVEPEETIEIAGNAGVGYTSTAVVVIEDNDIPPARIRLTATPARLLENADAPTLVTVRATVDGDTAFSRDTEVALELSGTAVKAVDYDVGGDLLLVIPAGELSGSARLNVTPIDDDLPEGIEHIVFTGTSVVRVVEAAIVLIDDDGEDLAVSFSRAEYAANEYGAPAEVVIRVTPAADRREVVSLSLVLVGGAGADDYSGVPAEVVFAPGQEAFSFTVEALPDEEYESGESLRLSLATLSTKVALEPIPAATVRLIEKRSLEEFSGEFRTVLALSARAWSDSVQSTLEERFGRTRQTEEWAGWQPGYEQPAPKSSAGDNAAVATPLPFPADRVIPGDWLASWRRKNERRNMGLIEPRLSLSKILAKLKGWRPVLWAEGSTRHFSGALDSLDYQGGFQAAHLGLDLHSGKKTLVGASLTRGRSLVDYSDGVALDGETEATLYSVQPYLHVQAHPRVALWAFGGLGRGSVAARELDRNHELASTARMAGGGLRILAKSWSGRELAIRSDGDLAWMGADLAEAPATIGAAAGRIRLLAELTETLRLAGQTLVAAGEFGGRLDRGAAHRGAGIEAGGRVSWRKPEKGFDLAAHGQTLLWQSSGFRIWGAGVQASWDPGAEKRGLVVRFASGRGPRGAKTRLFQEPVDRLLQPAADLDNELELGYGTGAGSRLLTLTFRLRGLSGWTLAFDVH